MKVVVAAVKKGANSVVTSTRASSLIGDRDGDGYGDGDRLYYDSSIRGYSVVINDNKIICIKNSIKVDWLKLQHWLANQTYYKYGNSQQSFNLDASSNTILYYKKYF